MNIGAIYQYVLDHHERFHGLRTARAAAAGLAGWAGYATFIFALTSSTRGLAVPAAIAAALFAGLFVYLGQHILRQYATPLIVWPIKPKSKPAGRDHTRIGLLGMTCAIVTVATVIAFLSVRADLEGRFGPGSSWVIIHVCVTFVSGPAALLVSPTARTLLRFILHRWLVFVMLGLLTVAALTLVFTLCHGWPAWTILTGTVIVMPAIPIASPRRLTRSSAAHGRHPLLSHPSYSGPNTSAGGLTARRCDTSSAVGLPPNVSPMFFASLRFGLRPAMSPVRQIRLTLAREHTTRSAFKPFPAPYPKPSRVGHPAWSWG